MWWMMVLLAAPAAAQDDLDEVALMAQRDVYASQAKALARSACKGAGRACRREVADAIRRTLQNPDDVEAEERLLEPTVAEKLPADFQVFLNESMFREAQWMAHDACLAAEAEALVRDADRLAAEYCDDCAHLVGFIERVATEGRYDPDPVLNELDAMEAFDKGPKQRALIQRLRNHVGQVCLP